MTTPFHERLRRFREDEGLSVNKAATRAGVSVDRWRDYEVGRATPMRLEIRKVFGSHCRIVNETPDDAATTVPAPPIPPPGATAPPQAPSLPAWSIAIRTERTREKLSQEDLAQLLDVHSNTVSNWETGRVAPIEAHAIKLVEVLPGVRDVLPPGRVTASKPGPAKAVTEDGAESRARPVREDAASIMKKIVVLANALRGCKDSYAVLRVDEKGARALLVVGGERVEELEREGGDGWTISAEILAELRKEARSARDEAEQRVKALRSLSGLD